MFWVVAAFGLALIVTLKIWSTVSFLSIWLIDSWVLRALKLNLQHLKVLEGSFPSAQKCAQGKEGAILFDGATAPFILRKFCIQTHTLVSMQHGNYQSHLLPRKMQFFVRKYQFYCGHFRPLLDLCFHGTEKLSIRFVACKNAEISWKIM